MGVFLDKTKDGYVEYDAVVLDPQNFGALNSDIAMSILKEMTYQPMCAMDLARKLGHHEQKIYYHLNKLQRAGIIKLVGTEKRYGMVAQLYDLVSPVIVAKIHDNGKNIESPKRKDVDISNFLEPFIINGKLNAKIILGDPYPHGKYNTAGLDSCYAVEIAMLLGTHVTDISTQCYLTDVHTKDLDLLGNLIIIGNPKTNTIVERMNKSMPINFEESNNFAVFSKVTNKLYDDDMVGLAVRMKNPLNPDKEIIVVGGRRTRGTIAAICAVTKHLKEFSKGNNNDKGVIARVVRGIDRDGDGFVDDCEFVE